MLLDYAVRADGAAAPWAAFGGAPYVLWAVAEILLSHLVWMRRWGAAGFALHLAVSVASTAADGAVSNSFGANVRWLRANGYSDAVTAATMLANLVASQALGFLVVAAVCTDALDVGTLARMASLPVLAKVAVNMAMGEVTFTLAHRALHRRLAGLHRMHHCCKRASWSTNLIFHPVDLALEFAGPVGCLLAAHYVLWDQDQTVLLLSYLILQVWYGLDHDEYLKLYHHTHHLAVDSVYTIYCKFKDDGSLDRVKPLLIKPATELAER